ncbi:MAG: (2Fe-2S)-binding protein [Wenzhouxiangellaceae bacterium]|nr:(2Fe-2S)-binding protein [Wenzhouxiangellaceae bacterium]
MFVCVCNAVSDREIRDLARRGVDSLEELKMLTGCGDCCGQCADEAETLLVSARRAEGPVLPIVEAIQPA